MRASLAGGMQREHYDEGWLVMDDGRWAVGWAPRVLSHSFWTWRKRNVALCCRSEIGGWTGTLVYHPDGHRAGDGAAAPKRPANECAPGWPEAAKVGQAGLEREAVGTRGQC